MRGRDWVKGVFLLSREGVEDKAGREWVGMLSSLIHITNV
jgi:hypothetical protein